MFFSKPIIFSSPTRIIRGHCRGASVCFFRNYILDFVILHSSWGFHIAASLPTGYSCAQGKQEVGRTVLWEARLSGAVLQEWLKIICRWFLPFNSPDSQCPIPQSPEVAVVSCSLEHPSWLSLTLCLLASPFVLLYVITLLKGNRRNIFPRLVVRRMQICIWLGPFSCPWSDLPPSAV